MSQNDSDIIVQNKKNIKNTQGYTKHIKYAQQTLCIYMNIK